MRLFLTLPAALALTVAAFPIMWVLFGRGAFTIDTARLASQSLAAYAIGLPAVVLLKVLAPAAFARGDTALPVKIGMVTLAVNFLLNIVFNAGALAPASIAGSLPLLEHIGPPLATSLASTFNMRGAWHRAASPWPFGGGRRFAAPSAAHGAGGARDGIDAVVRARRRCFISAAGSG